MPSRGPRVGSIVDAGLASRASSSPRTLCLAGPCTWLTALLSPSRNWLDDEGTELLLFSGPCNVGSWFWMKEWGGQVDGQVEERTDGWVDRWMGG